MYGLLMAHRSSLSVFKVFLCGVVAWENFIASQGALIAKELQVQL